MDYGVGGWDSLEKKKKKKRRREREAAKSGVFSDLHPVSSTEQRGERVRVWGRTTHTANTPSKEKGEIEREKKGRKQT